jgi:hypothetical protein
MKIDVKSGTQQTFRDRATFRDSEYYISTLLRLHPASNMKKTHMQSK